jgi:hypothetical protein
MTEFLIDWNDLDFSKREYILSSVKEEIKDDLEEEAKEKKISFEELITGKHYYSIDNDEFYNMNVAELIEELAQKRIDANFRHFYVEL